MSELTPEQSADVIKYYHDGENAEYRSKGWDDKVPLGRSAIHTALEAHTLLPGGKKPMLTSSEMAAGLEHIENIPKKKIDEKKLDELVDKGMSYYAARRLLELE